MTLPFKEWNNFTVRTIERASADNAENTPEKWTTTHYELSKLGLENDGVLKWGWKTLYRATSPDYRLVTSLDTIIDFGMTITCWVTENTEGVVDFAIWESALPKPDAPNTWDPDDVCGRWYTDELEWAAAYPYYMGNPHTTITKSGDLDDIYQGTDWMPSFTGGQAESYMHQDDLFRNGIVVSWQNYNDGFVPWGAGDNCIGTMELHALRIHYFNAIVNSMNRRSMPASGGVRIVLDGLAFDQADAEINDINRSPDNTPGKAWRSYVRWIDFIGNQGQGTYRLDETLGDFTRESDLRMVIPSMPPMLEGTYTIKLIKDNVAEIDPPGEVISYAGDFRATPEGRVLPGVSRFVFHVGALGARASPLGFLGWQWKIGCVEEDDTDNIITEYYAPIDIRSPEIFWDGRVLNVSNVTRSVDDFTGMFQVSDFNVDLASHDFHFQNRLAVGHCKNRYVNLDFGWANEPASWRQTVFKGIVDDYDLQGTTFKAVLKDISQKYFRTQIPAYTVTQEDYPNAYEQHIGRSIPELLGKHELTIDENPGAIEALYVDTTAFEYVCALRPLNSITAVYSNGALVDPANYAIFFDWAGRTCLRFTSDQGNNKITFNCTGYSLPAWNSANGYIQNPAYILGYFLAYILKVPMDLIDIDSLDDLAQLYTDNGWNEIGRLAIAARSSPDSIYQELLFSFGAKSWPAADGRFRFGRKDISNISTDLTLIAQTDLIDAPDRAYNLREAVNYIKARWDYYPAASLYKYAQEVGRETSELCYDVAMELPEWNYPWIDSTEFALQRMTEDLQRLAFGNRIVSFSLPIEFIHELDIFDNFYLQDPYGLSTTGAGEERHLYYVISISYDWENATIGIIGSDLQWLAGQCLIIAPCEEIVHNYATASEWQKTFGYIGSCATDELPGGDPLKKICKCE